MRNNTNKRVGIFSNSGYDIISNPLMNTVQYLCQLDYRVDIYGRQSKNFDLPFFDNEKVQYIIPKQSKHSIPYLNGILRLYSIYKHYLRGKRYDFFIGFDPGGLQDAACLGILTKTPYIYHSLEIVSMTDLTNYKSYIKKFIERILNKYALFTITQDELRANLIERENKIPREKIKIVYNSSIGNVIKTKSNWLRNNLAIPNDKVIVLAVGSLIKEHMIEEIVCCSSSWPKKYVLVLHGWFPDDEIEDRIKRCAIKYPERIYISEKILPFKDKYLISSSADIGLVFFKPVNENMRYTGAAAGKLFDFIQCGVPIIANNLPGMKNLVEDNGCGIVVDETEEIAHAVSAIDADYKLYSEKSCKAFLKYDFCNCYKNVLAEIEKDQKGQQGPLSF